MAGELIPDTAGGGAVTIAGQPISTDPTDRAGRLVGVVSAASLPLPTGAATEATLAAVSGKLPSVLVADRLKVDGSGVTQPVSLAAGVDVTDRAGRLVGVVSGTIDVTDRAGRLVGVVGTELPAAAARSDVLGNPTTPLVGAAQLGWAASVAQWQRALIDGNIPVIRPRTSNLVLPFAPLANTGGTITLPAGGAGTKHVITHLRFVRVATAALAGGALLTITTTNIAGAPTWRVGNAMAAGGTQIDMDADLASPLISNLTNTATTFVFPAPGAAVSWDIEIFYYLTTEAK